MLDDEFSELDLSKVELDSNENDKLPTVSTLTEQATSNKYPRQASYSRLEDTKNPPVFLKGYIVKITDPAKIGDGLSSYIVYHLEDKEFFVTRRFSDFLGLYEKLVVKYLSEGMIIPPAPTKDMFGTTKIRISKDASAVNEFVQRRRMALESHPVLGKDVDVHEFLQNNNELPRATNTQLLSGASAKKMIKNFGDAIGKLTYKMEDPDEFFYQKAEEMESWEKELKRLYSALSAMESSDHELAGATINLSRSIFALAKEEENTMLAQTLHRLGETEEQLAHLNALQAESQFCHLIEHIRETLGTVQACKNVLGERVRVFRAWKTAESNLRAKREHKVRMELAGKTDYYKTTTLVNEMQEFEDRVTESKKKFDDISTNIRKEFDAFEFNRFVYLKQAGIDYLEFMLQIQTKVYENWETYMNNVTCVH